jgi:cytochrome c553
MSPHLRTAFRWAARLTGGVVVLLIVVAASVYGISQHHATSRYEVPEHPLRVPTDSASIARGAHLAAVRGCAGCHGPDLTGQIDFDDPFIGRLAMPNLTRGGRGAELTDRDWERAVRHGVRRDGSPLVVMPAQMNTQLSDEDLGDIVAYARSLPASPVVRPASRLGPAIRAMDVLGRVRLFAAARIDHNEPHPARVAPAPTAEYGAYLAPVCADCHGEHFSGGRLTGAPADWKPPANITPEGIGDYTEADFVRALRQGVRPGGTAIAAQMPVERITRHFTDDELHALYAYLRTVPPRPYGGH